MICESNGQTDQDPFKDFQKPDRLNLSHFKSMKVIGKGSFGTISLGIHIPSNNCFAIKQLKKADMMKAKQIDHLRNEIYILNALKHPFIIRLYGVVQDSRYISLIIDYIPGGELFTILRETGRFGKPESIFYAANVVLAFQYLHSYNIVYRDLKPENLIIDVDGYLKLTDFGFAKIVTNRTYTLCGTPEYVAPEIIRCKGHGKEVDWWALGILMYEMLVGIDPFNANSPMETFKRILTADVVFPSKFYKDAKSLIKHLLNKDISKRYGNLVNGKLRRS